MDEIVAHVSIEFPKEGEISESTRNNIESIMEKHLVKLAKGLKSDLGPRYTVRISR